MVSICFRPRCRRFSLPALEFLEDRTPVSEGLSPILMLAGLALGGNTLRTDPPALLGLSQFPELADGDFHSVPLAARVSETGVRVEEGSATQAAPSPIREQPDEVQPVIAGPPGLGQEPFGGWSFGPGGPLTPAGSGPPIGLGGILRQTDNPTGAPGSGAPGTLPGPAAGSGVRATAISPPALSGGPGPAGPLPGGLRTGSAGRGVVGLSGSPPGSGGAHTPEPPPPHPALINWQKIQIDPVFRSEGVAVADIDQDGLPDIVVGDVWYQAPNWQRHEIRDVGDYGDGHDSYSNAFQVFTGDFNNDGWPDVLVVGFPGDPVYWYENPQNQSGHWREHLVAPSSANESPQFVDLFGDGQKELVMAIQPEGQMVWLRPGPDPTQPWVPHPISVPSTPDDPVPGTDIFSHGLGVGDLNGDGRLDVMTTGGWWEQPAVVDGTTPWPFHPADLGQPCADMYAYDMNGDGIADVISTSAHDYGMWWHEQVPGAGGDPTFVEHELLPPLFSESHALQFVDLNGDGVPDLVTGKRFWAHGPDGDPGAGEPAVLYWFEGQRQEDGSTQFIPHPIDDDSGIGTQFTVTDLNGDGLPDIITSNKKGVFVFEQEPSSGRPPFQVPVSAPPDPPAPLAGLSEGSRGFAQPVCPVCHCPQATQASEARPLHDSGVCPSCHCAPQVHPGGVGLEDPLGSGAGCAAC